MRVRFSIRPQGILSRVRLGRYHSAPTFYEFFGLISQDVAGQSQITLVFIGKLDPPLEQFQIAQ